jgi:hypothetical protein
MYTEEQYDEFAKRMHERFPLMFTRPYGGFAIGQGWWPIIESLCANIQSHIDWRSKQLVGPEVPQVVVAQIKEKFGGLRFYYDGGDDNVRGMVSMAESWANYSCEECGSPATTRRPIRPFGWISTLCEEHQQARMKNEQDDSNA